MKKFILILLIIPIFLFIFNVQFASAADNSALIFQLQQEIASLIRQIIVLLQQQIKTQTQIQQQSSNQSGSAVLTVNASGVVAYVSINNGSQFVYVSPINLNNGDTYLVTASVGSGGEGNSTSKCSGKASSGGSYVCNIKMNQY